MAKVIDFYGFLDGIAPFSSQAEWDNSGMLVGDLNSQVNKVYVCLDITDETVSEAAKNGCELIISHHPIIFSAQKSFTADSLSYKCAKAGISVISAHTCFDFAKGGVSDILAETLSLKNIRKASCGEYTLGESNFDTAGELALYVKKQLGAEVTVNLKDKKINTVAVCGGSGADLIEDALSEGADAFVTGEIKHHDYLDAAENGISVICAGHFKTEIIAMKRLYEMLGDNVKETEFIFTEQNAPYEYI